MNTINGINLTTINKSNINKKIDSKKELEEKEKNSNDLSSKSKDGDTFELSKDKVVNGKKEVDEKEIKKMMLKAEKETRQFTNLVNKMLGNQSKNDIISKAKPNDLIGSENSNGGVSAKLEMSVDELQDAVLELKDRLEDGTLEVSQEDIDKAKELTSEDGYYGVKQTSERILGFAKALSGGDVEKAEELRDAVTQAFEEVADMWGGMENAPQLTKDTYDAVMQGFDEWVGIQE